MAALTTRPAKRWLPRSLQCWVCSTPCPALGSFWTLSVLCRLLLPPLCRDLHHCHLPASPHTWMQEDLLLAQRGGINLTAMPWDDSRFQRAILPILCQAVALLSPVRALSFSSRGG